METQAQKFTNGPWAFTMQEEYGKPQFTAVMTGDNSALADVKFAFLMHPSECNANARLIAAAPELFEACKRIVAFANAQEPPYRLESIANQCRDALTKATGTN